MLCCNTDRVKRAINRLANVCILEKEEEPRVGKLDGTGILIQDMKGIFPSKSRIRVGFFSIFEIATVY